MDDNNVSHFIRIFTPLHRGTILDTNPANGTLEANSTKRKAASKPSTIDKTLLIEVVCSHKSALLMDAMASDVIVNVLIRKDRPPPVIDMPLEQMAEKKLYKGPNNEIGIPAECLFAALRAAGRKVKVGSKNCISTAKTTELPAILTIEEPFLPLVYPEGVDPNQPWKEDVRRGMMQNGANRVAVGIVRPRFNAWGFKATITVDLGGMDGLNEEHIRKLFEIAGNRIGVCSYRPACNGPFGRFKVNSWESTTG